MSFLTFRRWSKHLKEVCSRKRAWAIIIRRIYACACIETTNYRLSDFYSGCYKIIAVRDTRPCLYGQFIQCECIFLLNSSSFMNLSLCTCNYDCQRLCVWHGRVGSPGWGNLFRCCRIVGPPCYVTRSNHCRPVGPPRSNHCRPVGPPRSIHPRLAGPLPG